jgi:hypothetical protein
MPQRGFNVGVFRAEIESKDVQRNNNFLVEFQTPIGMFQGTNFNRNTGTARVLEYWCQGASTPNFTFATHNAGRYGYGAQEKRPFLGIFADITLNIVDDGASDNFAFFYDWQNLIAGNDLSLGPLGSPTSSTVLTSTLAPVTIDRFPYELGYAEEYKTNIRIFLYDQGGHNVRCYNLRQAWPISVGDLRQHWADDNSYSILPVVIAYTDWYNEATPVET